MASVNQRATMELPALVEDMQATLGQIRLRLTDAGPLTPGERALAADHVKVVASALGNLKRVVRRADADATDGQEGVDHVRR